jgi:hypothetical protein
MTRCKQRSKGTTHMSKLLNFNTVALNEVIENNEKIRVRVKDGVLQVRPTTRISGAPLPELDELLSVKVRMEDGRARGASVNVESFEVEHGQAYKLVKSTYGWHTLVAVEPPEKGTAYARVAIK